jgi:curved DNA-binding protein CbpA
MKDYYAILGVVPSAEDVVIRAAWKALAQRYHPDRFDGDAGESHSRMAEINEAYNVLSNPVERKAYDKSRGGKEGDFGDWVHEEESDQASNKFDPLEKDWALAVGYYPDLVNINNRLSKISNILAFSYRAGLLDIKAFENRKELAEVLEEKFLQSYFGNNPEIVDFARQLVLAGNKSAAKALNEAIRVLGSEVPGKVVVNKILKEYIHREITCPGCKTELLFHELGDLSCSCPKCNAVFRLDSNDKIYDIDIERDETQYTKAEEEKEQDINRGTLFFIVIVIVPIIIFLLFMIFK